jgi:hypothetical protein
MHGKFAASACGALSQLTRPIDNASGSGNKRIDDQDDQGVALNGIAMTNRNF